MQPVAKPLRERTACRGKANTTRYHQICQTIEDSAKNLCREQRQKSVPGKMMRQPKKWNHSGVETSGSPPRCQIAGQRTRPERPACRCHPRTPMCRGQRHQRKGTAQRCQAVRQVLQPCRNSCRKRQVPENVRGPKSEALQKAGPTAGMGSRNRSSDCHPPRRECYNPEKPLVYTRAAAAAAERATVVATIARLACILPSPSRGCPALPRGGMQT